MNQVHVYGDYRCKKDQTLLWTCVADAHLQCVKNYYAKFEFKGMKTIGVTVNTHTTKSKHSKGGVDVIMSKA